MVSEVGEFGQIKRIEKSKNVRLLEKYRPMVQHLQMQTIDYSNKVSHSSFDIKLIKLAEMFCLFGYGVVEYPN